MVYGQQASDSCGIASIMMVNFKMKKWQLAAALSTAPAGGVALPVIGFNVESAIKLEKQVYGAYSAVSGRPYHGDTGTKPTVLAQVLNKLGIGTWVAERHTDGALAGKIIDVVGSPAKPTPAILAVYWRGTGGHAIVCDNVMRTATGGTADFCDPWDTSVRTLTLTRGSPIVYDVGKQDGLIDFGRSHNDYTPSTGDMDSWIIFRVGD